MSDPIPTTVPDLIAHLRRWADENASHDGIGYSELLDELLRISTARPGHIVKRGLYDDLRCLGCGSYGLVKTRAGDDDWAAAVDFTDAHRGCRATP